MSFPIVAQTSSSEKNKLDKSLTTIDTLTGVLREDSSIIDPVIVVEKDLSYLTACNYMTIESFGRSYFVTNIVSIEGGLTELHGHCDVLSSFKTQIRSNYALIKNSERNWNLYLNDGSFRTYQYPYIYTKKFSGGFPQSNDTYILAVAGS